MPTATNWFHLKIHHVWFDTDLEFHTVFYYNDVWNSIQIHTNTLGEIWALAMSTAAGDRLEAINVRYKKINEKHQQLNWKFKRKKNALILIEWNTTKWNWHVFCFCVLFLVSVYPNVDRFRHRKSNVTLSISIDLKHMWHFLSLSPLPPFSTINRKKKITRMKNGLNRYTEPQARGTQLQLQSVLCCVTVSVCVRACDCNIFESLWVTV